MLTKKHFAAIAAALKDQKPNSAWVKTADDKIGYTCAAAQWTLDCRALAAMYARENPNFDRARFLAACGVED